MPNQNDRDKPAPSRVINRARVLTSRDLFDGCRRVDIEHQGEIYRLQITRQGRLILTK